MVNPIQLAHMVAFGNGGAAAGRVAQDESGNYPVPYLGTMGGNVGIEAPTTQETVAALRDRLVKELYRLEMDLQGGARIAGKPCDCLSRKHLQGIEATAEELMSYENNPVYSQIVGWLELHRAEFEPSVIATVDPYYYQSLAPEIREFRKLL